jgi:catechol 2,3-dioxygenase-like lactoylglutathione lyase family enzyme
VTGPDGVKIEVQEEASQAPRAVAQHLHYLLPDFMSLRAWYVGTFTMPETIRGPHPSADIPGMNFTFAVGPALKYTSMKGGLIDHIGIEVKNLEAYCRKLTAAGVKLDVPYTKDAKTGIAYAFLTDPVGTYIELTEGLDKY